MAQNRRRWSIVVLGFAALLALVSAPLSAQVVKKRVHTFDDLAFQRSEFRLSSQIAPLDESRTLAATTLQQDFDTLLTREEVLWQMGFDRMTGLPNSMGGEGIPWIPGSGRHNALTAKQLGLKDGEPVPVPFVAKKALDLVRTYPALFGAKVDELSLVTEGSGPVLDYMYYVQFDWVYQGVPVEKARLAFTVNHGNLIEVGQTNIGPAIRGLNTVPTLDLETAWQIAYGYLGEPGPDPSDTVVEPGRLLIVPAVTGLALQGLPSEPGQGLGYRLVWAVAFHRDGVMGNWEARIDAHTGEVLGFTDINAYGSIKGGVYKTDKPFAEQKVPLPRADYGTGTYADDAGNFSGSTGTSTLSGQYVKIADVCGTISLGATGGVIDFGTSGGYDCTTPGSGGSGNTHAARTQYWNVTQIKLKAATYLTRTWLTSQLTDNVNINQTCNAYWLNPTLNFFRSGGGCWNTGELPGVSLHEFGHGLDSNDGNGSSPDGGTGETYGDITALLQTHNSCMGNGFMATNCAGYGDACAQCTGVRELDYMKHASKAPALPSQLTGTSGFHCSTATCAGPCGYECHCESEISSEAVYDLATRDLITWGMDQATAWQTVDRLWYVSRPTATGAYRCPSVTTTDGCAAGTLWRVFRAADDDDGDTTNGTPHSTALYTAFSRHAIACAGDTGSNTNSTACSSLARPAVNATAANNQVLVNWNTIANATNYLVFRNETSCEAGYTKVQTVAAPTTTYTDTMVVSGITYFYRIQAQGSDTDCLSPVSDCGTATPLGCTPPTAPTGLTATPNGTYRIDLVWNSVAGAAQYALYRGTASGGPYTALATVSSAVLSYSDTAVVGSRAYYYVVRTVNGCESINSTQASATAGGTCNVGPTFSGIVSAANALTATCGNVITWAAGTSNCGGTVTYTVYRSRAAGFTPDAGYAIASGLSGTTYTDNAVAFGTNYYYAVRAFDSVSGLSDSNVLSQMASPTAAATTAYTQTFESASDWTSVKGTPAAATGDFVRGIPVATTGNLGEPSQPGAAHGGSNCWYTATNPAGSAGVDDVDDGEVMTVSPSMNLSAYPTGRFQMYRWFVNEYSDDAGDYYILEGSNNNGSTWVTLESIPDTVCIQNGATINQWNYIDIKLDDYLTLTNQMQFRVRVSDGGNTGGLIECAMDDISVKGYPACTGCTPPSVPAGLGAVANGSNRIDLSWSAASGAATYRVYRKSGACGSGYTQIAGNIAGTTYSDTAVSGGSTYAYVVRALTAAGCESADSTCASTAATGPCNIPPTFAGASSVTNSHTSTCGITVGWSAATSNCSGTIRYNVYRSTSSSYTPGASTLVAKALNATSYSDTSNLVYGTSYTYLVRAEDLSIAGAGPSGGTEEGNLVFKSTGPSGGQLTGSNLFFDDFETGSGTRGWDKGSFVGTDTTMAEVRGVQTCSPTASGTKIWRWGASSCTGSYTTAKASFASPLPGAYGLDIPFDATNVKLTFSHRWLFAAGDGATLLLQKSPTRTYYGIKATAITAGQAYTATINSATNPLTGYPAWTSSYNTQMYSTTVDLDAACVAVDGKPCAGSSLAIAFVGTSDGATNSYGWFLDDVRVYADYGTTSCTTAGCSMVVQLTPTASSVAAGSDIVFAVSHTSGAGPYTYQWTEDGSNIAGATSATLAVNKATAQSHTYNCKVTDVNGPCASVTAATGATGTWTSGAANPPAVPNNGDVPGTAFTLVKNGANVDAAWDSSCVNDTDYRILWGDLASLSLVSNVTNGTVTSATCSLGTSGTATGVTSPTDFSTVKCYFAVIDGINGSSFGRHGNNSAGNERVLSGDTTFCSASSKNTTATTCQ